MPQPTDALIERSANAWLQNESIRHAVYLRRYSSYQRNKVLGFLNDEVYPDALGILEGRLARANAMGRDSGPWTTQYYQDMVDAFGRTTSKGIGQAYRHFKRDMLDLASSEAGWAQRLLGSAVPGADFSVFLPADGFARVIVNEQPFQGALMKEWFGGLAPGLQAKVDQQLKIGMFHGESTQNLARRIRGKGGVVDLNRRQAEAVVRTATNHVSTQARQATYQENPDLVQGWQFVATLDARTTLECASQDGKVFPLGTGPMPPLHWQCRSVDVPMLPSWRDIGIDLDEAPEGTRASMDGQVPESQTYSEWLRGQPREIQKEVLGAARAELYRAGNLDIGHFVDVNLRPLTLAELEKLEGR